MGKMPWFKFNAADWISSETVMLLSWAQKGIYTHLLAHSWLHPGCSIPKDLDLVKRLLPKAKTKDIDVVLAKCFQSADERETNASPRLTNMRLRSTHSEALGKSENARTSAKVRWDKEKQNANALKTHSDGSKSAHAKRMIDVDVDKDKDKETTKTKKLKTSLPADFKISKQVKLWAVEKGYNHLEEHFESFKQKCLAHAYKYVDWDAAFMEAIRGNWAQIKDEKQKSQNAAGQVLKYV